MKISKEKRTKLILVAIATAGVLFALWWFLIQAQQKTLEAGHNSITTERDKEQRMQQAVKVSNTIQAELNAAREKMAEAEKGMATGDLYSWMYNTIKDFKTTQHVEIPQFSSVDAPVDCNLIYKFPFKQVKMTINGIGFFHDIGKFIADFENQFPYIRIENLNLSPANTATGEREKISFRMDIVALVKTPDTK